MRKHYYAMVGVSFFVLTSFVGTASAEPRGNDFLSAVATGVYSAMATVVAAPIRFATCGALAAVGGAGHGLSGGESEIVREELLSAIPSACGPILKTLPTDVTPYLEQSEPRDMAW